MTEEDYLAVMARGTAAESLLRDDTLTAALDAIEAQAVEDFKALAWGTSPVLMQAQHMRVKAVEDLRSQLRAWADAAKKTAFDLNKRNSRAAS